MQALKELLADIQTNLTEAVDALSGAEGKEKFPYVVSKNVRLSMQKIKKLAQTVRTTSMELFKEGKK